MASCRASSATTAPDGSAGGLSAKRGGPDAACGIDKARIRVVTCARQRASVGSLVSALAFIHRISGRGSANHHMLHDRRLLARAYVHEFNISWRQLCGKRSLSPGIGNGQLSSKRVRKLPFRQRPKTGETSAAPNCPLSTPCQSSSLLSQSADCRQLLTAEFAHADSSPCVHREGRLPSAGLWATVFAQQPPGIGGE